MLNFRYDINGLRAIAVIAVVLFHFTPEWLAGGFVGVDIFFVISGFLMTKIIFTGLENNNFSLFKFYFARAKRIIPVLAVLCLTLLLLGWFFLFSLDYNQLVKHALSSLGFFSNIVYFNEVSYFDTNAYEKWLLHTWSLSAEWQFYMLYPMTLVAMQKLAPIQTMKKIILAATLLGFIFSVIASVKWSNASYYLLPARIWEMTAGGVAYLFPFTIKNKHKSVLEFFGLALIIVSFIFISNEALWSGYLAFFPVMGAFLLIQAQKNNSIITGNFVFQQLGKWSYSIYLWHWPIVVAIYYFALNEYFIYLGMGLSILLGYLSYNYVEQLEFRKNIMHIFKLLKCKIFYFFLLVLPLSFETQAARINSEKENYLLYYQRKNYLPKVIQEYKLECDFFDITSRSAKKSIPNSCVNNGKDGIFLWGDSHAQALSYGLRNAFPNVNFNQVASSDCRPSLNEDTRLRSEFRIACNRSNEKAKKEIININPDVILLAQQLGHDKNDYQEIVQYIKANNLKSTLFLVGPVPQWKSSLPEIIVRRYFDKDITIIKDNSFVKKVLTLNAHLHKKYDNSEVNYISLIDTLCNNNGCLAKIDDENTALLWDSSHLSIKASKFVVNNIIKDKLVPYLLLQK